MPGKRRHESPVGVSSPTKVGFHATLVTGVSRPLRGREHWTIYYFEKHAAKCLECRIPDQVQREGRQLCRDGFDLAADVAGLLFKLRLDGSVYTTSRREGQAIRVEIPPDYPNVISLLKAFRRSGRGVVEEPPSYDRNYPIPPRSPRQGEVRDPREPVSLPFHTRTISPGSPPRSKKGRSRQAPGRTSHGSLAALDEIAQQAADDRERLCRYDLAVPEPRYYRSRSRR